MFNPPHIWICDAATTIQCWKRRIWLDRWFAQQALQRQKRLRLQLLCRGASAYAMSVRGDHRPPPTPTNKTSDPKVLRHPFRDRGLPLPQRRRARRNNCPRCRPGRRNRPRAPNSGGGALCMPLCFWAAQSAVAASELCVGTGRSLFSPYLPPHTAATAIQRVYRSYVDKEVGVGMEAEFVLGRVCIGTRHASGYARSVGLRLLLDTSLG